MTHPWIVCQIGAREHYILAAELHRRRRLAALCTDAWVVPDSMGSRLAGLAGTRGRQLSERFSPDLASARVISEPMQVVLRRKLLHRTHGLSGWDSIIAANEAFGGWVSATLRRSGLLKGRPTIFSYSYAARQIFESAKEAGCMTVLGQIDPGPVEDQLVSRIARKHEFEVLESRPPESYWSNWRLECDLADRIVVNSRWSRDALMKTGIDGGKVFVVPLAYVSPQSKETTPRIYPKAFTPERPLRLLFLGQVNVRKGAIELLRAMERLIDAPVRLSLVGHAIRGLHERFGGLPNVDWRGPAARSAVAEHYRTADVFILPTHSDGFALTQLEAASHGLPLVVSKQCGDVVSPGVGGLLIDPVSTESIVAAIRHVLEPGVLGNLSAHTGATLQNFAPERVVDQLLELCGDMH